jgi:hypothetical protein
MDFVHYHELHQSKKHKAWEDDDDDDCDASSFD